MNRRLRHILIRVLFIFLVAYAAVNLSLSLRWLATSSSPGWLATTKNDRTVIVSIRGDAALSTIKVGDEILSINNREVKNNSEIVGLFERWRPGTSYNIVVKRDGLIQEFSLTTTPFPSIFIWGIILAVGVV